MFGEAINTFLFFLRFNLCICLWLHWVFVAIPRLSLAAARKKIFCLGGGWATLVACRLLIAVASLVELGLKMLGLQKLWHTGPVVAHGLSCSAACGIFPDQGSNMCLLH